MKNAPRITEQTPIQFSDALPEAVDIVIIGAGVIGTFAALYLTRLGKRVLLCEKGRVAGEQSSRNWGWIRQQGRDEAELPIMMQSLELWHAINEELHGEPGVRTAGISYLASTEAEMAELLPWLDIAKQAGLESIALTKEQINQMTGGVSNQQWLGGIHTPSDACGEPWQAVPAVAKLAQKEGCLIREDCAVRTLETHNSQVTAVHTESGTVRCEQVILAAGAWSSVFARNLGIDLPQLAVTATVAQTEPCAEFCSANMLDEKLAWRRRRDGGYTLSVCDRHDHFIGPDSFHWLKPFLPMLKDSWKHTHLHPGAPKHFPNSWGLNRHWNADEESPFERKRVIEPAPSPAVIRQIKTRFAERFPKAEPIKIKHSWAGFIDAMPDVVPVVDRTPQLTNLIIATGMSGHGFGIGPGFGRVLARMAMGLPAEHDLARFRYSRFTDGTRLVLGPAL